jgi:uncharacterized protein YfeS
VYEDQAGEFAPFGTDEGWDLLHGWAQRRSDLTGRTAVVQILHESDFAWAEHELDVREPPGIPRPGRQVDAATIIVGAGFTLLRLTGHIDADGRKLTLRALDVLTERYGSPAELLRQRADLASWRD